MAARERLSKMRRNIGRMPAGADDRGLQRLTKGEPTMKNISPAFKKVAVALAVAGAVSAAPAQAAGTLNVYNWGEYISPEILDQFSKEFDVEVNLDTYSSNEEMLAKIQAGATGYDLVFPSVHMNDIMLQLGLLEKTNVNQMPGFENID